jgi:PTS system mannose-specific IIA component
MKSNKPLEDRIIGVIVTHGGLAAELLRTAELIVGRLEGCFAVSGSDLCDETLIEKIRGFIGDHKGQKAIIFIDYYGGSCCTNSVRATEGIQGVKVVSGVNLPMILDFVTKRSLMRFEEMVDHLIQRGRESVKVIDL